jgi:DNA-binding beta-propeller fold protein YncE
VTGMSAADHFKEQDRLVHAAARTRKAWADRATSLSRATAARETQLKNAGATRDANRAWADEQRLAIAALRQEGEELIAPLNLPLPALSEPPTTFVPKDGLESAHQIAATAVAGIRREKKALDELKKRRQQIMTGAVIALLVIAAGVALWVNQMVQTERAAAAAVAATETAQAAATATKVAQTATVTAWEAEVNRALPWSLLQRVESESNVHSAALSPSGQVLATAGVGTVWLWQMPGGEILRTLEGLRDSEQSMAFSPDGEMLALGGRYSYDVLLWRVSDGTVLHTLHAGNPLKSIAFSPDGKILASGGSGGEIVLWRVSDGLRLRTLKQRSVINQSVAFSPDGHALAAAVYNNRTRLWRVSDGELLREFDHGFSARSVAFSPDGQILAIAGTGSYDGCGIYLVQVSDGELLRTIKTPRGCGYGINALSFSPDGQILAAAVNDRPVWVWRVSSGSLLATLNDQNDASTVAFSPDGKILFAGGGGPRRISLWRSLESP